MLTQIEQDLASFPDRVKTKLLRDIAKAYKKELTTWNLERILELCETLLQKQTRHASLFAYQLVYDQRSKYHKDTFHVFDRWTKQYIRDWWDCDDFMTHGVMSLLRQFPDRINDTRKWMSHKEFAVRRSAAVCLIPLAKKKQIPFSDIKQVCDTLLQDEHYLVQKGYGWLLKESVKHYHDDVVTYLESHVDRMPRTAFRYALEKLPKDEKVRLMAL